MANYTKTTDFAAKDTLPGGDTNKVVRGSEFETEFDAISTAIATKSNTADPTFTGTVTIPTVDINAGAIDGTVIGANSAAAGTFTNLTATTADINAGTIDNAVIGGSTAAAGTFTNLVATTADINGGTVDGATIGGSSAGAGTFTNLTASGTVNFSGATVSNLGTITTANLDGGTADNVVIGGSTPAAGTFTSVVATTADINGGTADNVVIGGATPAAGTFSSLTATTADINGGTIDGVSIGSSSTGAGAFSTLTVGGASVLTSVAFSNLDAGAVTTSSETFSDVDNQIPTNAAVIDYVAATIPLISEVNDLSSVVTWANVPDANITQSSVTQHQAALAITPSQIAGGTSPTFTATASGALANGDKVVLNTDGTVSVIAGGTGSTGSHVTFNSGDTEEISAVFDSSNNKVVVVFRDWDNSSQGTALVGTISGSSISFGSKSVFETGTTTNTAIAFDSSNNKVVIAYTDGGNSNYGTAVVGAVSGTSISFGTPVVFESASTAHIVAAFDSSNNKVVIGYRDGGNSGQGTAIVGTLSGTSISFGTAVVYEAGDTRENAITFDSSNNKVVLAYQDFGNSSHGTAIVGTLSGTSISFGTAVVFNAGSTDEISATFDTTNNKAIICYRDVGNSESGTAIVGTLSGTSISFGSEATFYTEVGSAIIQKTSIAFHSVAGKALIFFRANNDVFTTEATVSGTSISFTDNVTIQSDPSDYPAIAFDSNSQAFALFYNDDHGSLTGQALVKSLTFTNLTSNNFIGISNAAYSNGATATIQIVGSIDDAQSSLVTGSDYYVQTNGTLNTTKGTPEVYAGKAISSTKLAIQHPEVGASQSLVFIQKYEPGGSTDIIDIEAFDTSQYSAYMILLDNLIHASGNGDFRVYYKVDGSYREDNKYSRRLIRTDQQGTGISTSDNSSSSQNKIDLGNEAEFTGLMHVFFTISDNAVHDNTLLTFDFNGQRNSGGENTFVQGSATYYNSGLSSNRLEGLRIDGSSNLTGTVSLYGINKG